MANYIEVVDPKGGAIQLPRTQLAKDLAWIVEEETWYMTKYEDWGSKEINHRVEDAVILAIQANGGSSTYATVVGSAAAAAMDGIADEDQFRRRVHWAREAVMAILHGINDELGITNPVWKHTLKMGALHAEGAGESLVMDIIEDVA